MLLNFGLVRNRLRKQGKYEREGRGSLRFANFYLGEAGISFVLSPFILVFNVHSWLNLGFKDTQSIAFAYFVNLNRGK